MEPKTNLDYFPPGWLALAGDLLDKAAGEFHGHGCNDWDFPSDWTRAQREEMVKSMHLDNSGSLDEWERGGKSLDVPDWWVMQFLARRLTNAAKE